MGLPDDRGAEQHGPGEGDEVVFCIESTKGPQFDVEAEDEEAEGCGRAGPENALFYFVSLLFVVRLEDGQRGLFTRKVVCGTLASGEWEGMAADDMAVVREVR